MPTRRKKPRLYWDSNCFIALFNDEPTTDPQTLDALVASYDDMLDGRLAIVTCDLFRAEVFPDVASPEVTRIVDNLQACKDFAVVELRTPVMELAGNLRQDCLRAKPKRKLKTPDAQHVAAATLAGVEEFWTTDRDLIKYYKAGLLGSVLVCLPHVDQGRFRFD